MVHNNLTLILPLKRNTSASKSSSWKGLSAIQKARILNAKSPNTQMAYASDWKNFLNFCNKKNLSPLPASAYTIIKFIDYLLQEKKMKGSTISRKISGLSWVHRILELKDPCSHQLVRESLKGARRESKSKIKKALPLRWNTIREIVKIIPETKKGKRDKLIFLLGFAGAMRRDEIRNLKIEDLHFSDKGLVMDIRDAKTAKAGEVQHIIIPQGKSGIIPRLKRYIKRAGLTKENYLFNGYTKTGAITIKDKPLAPNAINRVVKFWCGRFGLDSEIVSSHGFRRGFISECVERGIPLNSIQAHSRHKVPTMILEYSQLEEGFENHAGKDFL